MAFQLIETAAQLAVASTAVGGSDRIALDCEAAGFHRYSDELCLVQLSTERETFIVDPLAIDARPLLRPLLEGDGVEVIMHGADFDLRLLDRDLGLRVENLFDTQAAAGLLGEEALGLSALVAKHVGVTLSKKYQRADWAKRPLTEDMLEYAAGDTRYLHRLADVLTTALRGSGRAAWASEEFSHLEGIRWEEPPEQDPVTRVKGARDLDVHGVAVLREALLWRDRVARSLDLAPFRVAGDAVLMRLVQERPKSVGDLAQLRGLNRRVVERNGHALLARIAETESTPEGDLQGYPERDRSGTGRPPPEVEELVERLKKVRNARARELGIDRGILLSNAMLLEVARCSPSDVEGLEGVPGVKKWQAGVLGEAFVPLLAH